VDTAGAIQESTMSGGLAGAGPIGMSVLLLLIMISIWSWAITVAKWLEFRKARKDSEGFSSIFLESRNLSRIEDSAQRFDKSPLVRLFRAGNREVMHLVHEKEYDVEDLSSVSAALRRAEIAEAARLEKGITFLATVASAAPFIGLFGTVWGIMTAFHGLSQAKSSTIQAVAPGISEALVATAVGLAAAIPAAVAYNYFAVAIKQFRSGMNAFSSDFLLLARRSMQRS
jgi:biopolymer transport protein TolQ